MNKEREKIIINKLILIGNGFDLSLDLETSYKDFLLWYIQDFLINVFKRKFFYDVSDGVTYQYYHEDRFMKFGYLNFPDDIFEDEDIELAIKSFKSLEKIELFFLSNTGLSYKKKFNSELFRRIYERGLSNWVDIEGVYFELLKAIIKTKGYEQIDKLNKDFDFITKKLEEYLSGVRYNKDNLITQTSHTLRKLIKPVEVSELIDVSNDLKVETKSYCFLNFNYTNTVKDMVSNYFSFKGMSNYEINHIHGELNSIENPIIFGFGDEMDDEYSAIEKLNDNRFLHFIKSFRYSKNSNYRNLLRFLNSGDYQVVVYGHSCGLSDRVMLNEIFEHENCKSIKIYFYKDPKGNDDFMSKNMEISRHFKNNKLMRQKIVEKSDSDFVHQIKLK